jgi:hypothetical protein
VNPLGSNSVMERAERVSFHADQSSARNPGARPNSSILRVMRIMLCEIAGPAMRAS